MRAASFEPLVSIVIPNYNYGRFLAESLDSALSQDYPRIEVVVIDNASTDNSREVIERYAGDPRVSMYFNDTNIGRNNNCNRGIEFARGEYMTLLSSDDFYAPGAISRLVEFLRSNPRCDAVYANAVKCDAQGRLLDVPHLAGQIDVQGYNRRNTAAALISSASYMWLPTCLVKRDTIRAFGAFDPSFEVGCDYALHCRMAFGGVRFGFVNEILASIRMHGENPSGLDYLTSGLSIREVTRVFGELLRGENLAFIRGEEELPFQCLQTLAAPRAQHPELARAWDELQPAIAELRQRLQQYAAEQRSFPPSALRPKPTVSVILTRTRPGNGELQRAVEAACNQSYDPIEIIVVDESTYDITGLVSRLVLPDNVQYVRYTGTGGSAGARNAGARLSSGDVLIFASDVAVLHPRFVSDAVGAIRLGADAAICGFEIALERHVLHSLTGQEIERRSFRMSKELVEHLAVAPCVPLEAFAFRRSAFLKHNALPNAAPGAAEWLMELATTLSGQMAIIPYANVTLFLRPDVNEVYFWPGQWFGVTVTTTYARAEIPPDSPLVPARALLRSGQSFHRGLQSAIQSCDILEPTRDDLVLGTDAGKLTAQRGSWNRGRGF